MSSLAPPPDAPEAQARKGSGKAPPRVTRSSGLRGKHARFRVLVCCGSDWWPYSRLLWTLRRAGFETHLIAPRRSITGSSRYRDELFVFDPGQDLAEMLKARLKAQSYDWVYVGDEPSLQTLAAHKHEAWAKDIFPVQASHPCFDVMLDKHAFLRLLAALDVPIVPGGVANDEAEAHGIAVGLGYPLAVKLGHGQGGAGVFRVDNARQLQSALERVRGQYPVRLETWLLEPTGGTEALFAHGELVGWSSSIKVRSWPEPTGPSCVRRMFQHALIEPSLRRFGAATGYHGLCSPEWVVAPELGLCFIELNPRAASTIHHDRFDEMDFAPAFVAFSGGEAYRQRAPPLGERGPRIHMFPQHVLYCVQSRDWRELRRWLPLSGTDDILWGDPGPLYAGLRQIACACLTAASRSLRQLWHG